MARIRESIKLAKGQSLYHIPNTRNLPLTINNNKSRVTLDFTDSSLLIHSHFETVTEKERTEIDKKSEQSITRINLLDIIGARRVKGKNAAASSSYFCIFVYPIVSQGFRGKRKIRQRKAYQFEVTGTDKPLNAAKADAWVELIREIIFPAIPAKDLITKQRRLYALINPRAGAGSCLQIFHDLMMPIFTEANIFVKLVITEKANHAYHLVQDLDLSTWDGIVIVSGDGLLYEVLNGLLQRPDREEALKIPVGLIPGGSGNALATSFCYACGEPLKDFLLHSTLMVARPSQYYPIKLIHVETDTGLHMTSFLSLSWGLLADIDIESERFRKVLGSGRFIPGSVIRCLGLRTYKGKVSFLPLKVGETNGCLQDTHPEETPARIDLDRSKSFFTEETDFETPISANNPENLLHRSQSVHTGVTSRRKSSQNQQEYEDMDSINLEVEFEKHRSSSDPVSSPDLMVQRDPGNSIVENPLRGESVEFTLRKHHITAGTPSIADYTSFNTSENFGPKDKTAEIQSFPNSSRGTATEIPSGWPIPRLDEPVPSNWTVMEGEFVLVTLSLMSHIGVDMTYVLESKLDDDIIYLTMLRNCWNVPKPQLCLQTAKMLTKLETGEHRKTPNFEVIPTRAVRLEPATEDGVVAVDGEVVKCRKFQAVATSLRATLMGRQKDSE